MRLLLLTDRAQLPLGRSLVSALSECAAAGASHVVVRELDLPDHQRAALVRRLAAIPGLTVIAAHRWLPCAAGVHLPARSSCNAELSGLRHAHEPAEDLITPRYSWVGRSCHTAEEVRRAATEGATYTTLSPWAETPSKPGYGPPVPRAAFAGHEVPVLALGGITPGNARAAIEAGASGVAVMGAVMRAQQPGSVVQDLLEAVR